MPQPWFNFLLASQATFHFSFAVFYPLFSFFQSITMVNVDYFKINVIPTRWCCSTYFVCGNKENRTLKNIWKISYCFGDRGAQWKEVYKHCKLIFSTVHLFLESTWQITFYLVKIKSISF